MKTKLIFTIALLSCGVLSFAQNKNAPKMTASDSLRYVYEALKKAEAPKQELNNIGATLQQAAPQKSLNIKFPTTYVAEKEFLSEVAQVFNKNGFTLEGDYILKAEKETSWGKVVGVRIPVGEFKDISLKNLDTMIKAVAPVSANLKNMNNFFAETDDAQFQWSKYDGEIKISMKAAYTGSQKYVNVLTKNASAKTSVRGGLVIIIDTNTREINLSIKEKSSYIFPH